MKGFMAEKQVLTKGEDIGTLDRAVVEMLQESELVSADLIQAALSRSHGDPVQFERLLLNEGYLTEEQLTWVKAQAYGTDFVNLRQEPISDTVLRLLPKAFVQAQKVVPFEKDGKMCVAVADQSNGALQRLLRKKFGSGLPIRLAMESAIAEALARYEVSFSERCVALFERHERAQAARAIDDDSILSLIDALLSHSVRSRASDVHIEPRMHECIVRLRIDGVLRTLLRYKRDVHPLVVLRIKVLTKLATDEHSAPQDGKFSFDGPDGKRVDVRVSIIATTHGEKIALRLLVAQNWALSLEHIGLLPPDQKILEQESQKSWGMVLATGPTGCGKTTTLYALLRRINSEDVNISTIEDPVEYDLPGTNQIQVNEKVGLSFATGLRSVVRQDPDDILVGEVRDPETATIAVNAAMTGHLVLSTLHTNDAATAVLRLNNMGVEPFLISSTVNVIVAQRLVRKVCQRCRSSVEMDVSELAHSFPAAIIEKIAHKQKSIHVYRGQGCEICAQSGYHGRTGIFEVLRITDPIRTLIMQRANADVIERAAIEHGMTNMLSDGIEKALQGITSIEEVLRVIRS